MIPSVITSFTHFAVAAGDACTPQSGDFLGFPKWWAYLSGQQVMNDPSVPTAGFYCAPKITSLSNIWLIVAAGIEILLRVAALAAIGYVLYGGIEYIRSQGEPGKTQEARQTIINAIAGLVISIGAATIVSYTAGQFK